MASTCASQKVDDNVHSLDIAHVPAPGTLWLIQNVLSQIILIVVQFNFNKKKVKKRILMKNVGEL